MKTIQIALLLTRVFLGIADGNNLTQIEEICLDYSTLAYTDYGKVVDAVQIGDCTVSCTFRQALSQQDACRNCAPEGGGGGEAGEYAGGEGLGGGGGGGGGSAGGGGSNAQVPDDSVDPAMDISENGAGTVDTQVEVAASGLQPCGQDKVCVSGKCTNIVKENMGDCITNAGSGAVAVQSSKKCLLKCLRVVTNYNTASVNSGTAKQLLILNLVKPNKSPCGVDKVCNAGYCMSKSLYPGKCV